MMARSWMFGAASMLALTSQFSAQAQTSAPPGTPTTTDPSEQPLPAGDEIVVTGIRRSLERAAEIKQAAVQVVDSIVAQDIGKFPDPTTASALQRVPGVQVQNDRNNELGGVRIRGLTDILTTVDGRELFTTTGRNFDLQDLPAEALARVDVFKSQTADLIEGSVAGAIDLKLNKPFNFRDPTVVLSARQNYATRVDAGNPLLGVLLADRFNTGIGEIGALVNATYSHARSSRSQSNMTDRRSSISTPFLTSPTATGLLIPQVIQNMPDVGTITRKQVNAALQWQVAPSLQAYVDGLYTYFRTTSGFIGFNPQPFTTNVRISDVVASDDCFDARVANANGLNPTIINNSDGTRSLQPFTVQRVCDFKSATFSNIVINQNSSSRRLTQKNKMVAGGLRFDQDRLKATLDAAYQTSNSLEENVNAEVGQRVPTLRLETDYQDGPRVTVGPEFPLNRNLFLRNSFDQNFARLRGSLVQTRADGEYEFDGLLSKLQLGLRYADRKSVSRSVQQSNPIAGLGFGNIGTATEPTARLVSSLPLSYNFLSLGAFAPHLNGGTDFVGVNPAYLRSEAGRNELRTLFGRPLRQPDYDPTRQFDAEEKTYSAYGQASYKIPIASDISLAGVVGVRATKTNRTIAAFRRQTNGTVLPVSASTSDTDFLPNATATLKLPGGFQSRFNYSKTLRRPDFGSLNPALALTLVGNPLLLNTGSSGNPDLKPQKSDSFDVSAEYYFRSGFVAITGYHREIKNRVVSSATQETIDGLNYLVNRPRNVGQAKLQGVEVNGQYFFDFLPGIFSGLGTLGAFTFADSEVGGNDQLVGLPLQGVSKYNYTAGLLYDKFGLSGRIVYTFRSRYFTEDNTGGVQLRPIEAARVSEVFVPTVLTYVRPAGRLDFGLGYDVTSQFRIDIGGINVLRQKTRQYRGEPFLNSQVFGDETTYTIGVRVRL